MLIGGAVWWRTRPPAGPASCPAEAPGSAWPSTAEQMDDLLMMDGRRIPDTPGTPGRGKVEWRPNCGTKITFEPHPYHPTAPDWHKGPHFHLGTPGIKPHQRYVPGDRIPGRWLTRTMMNEAATTTIRDVESSDDAVAIVRYDESRVALCLSLKSDGDVEIVMNKADAGRLIEALKKATSKAWPTFMVCLADAALTLSSHAIEQNADSGALLCRKGRNNRYDLYTRDVVEALPGLFSATWRTMKGILKWQRRSESGVDFALVSGWINHRAHSQRVLNRCNSGIALRVREPACHGLRQSRSCGSRAAELCTGSWARHSYRSSRLSWTSRSATTKPWALNSSGHWHVAMMIAGLDCYRNSRRP